MPALFEEDVMATVQEGEFVIYLGETAPLDLALFRDTDSVYLGAQIGDDPEGRPLVRLATAPFAAYARYCGDAETLGGLTSGQLRDFDRLVNVPTEFPPAPHSHADDEGFASGTYIPSFSAVDGEPAPTSARSSSTATCASGARSPSGVQWRSHWQRRGGTRSGCRYRFRPTSRA